MTEKRGDNKKKSQFFLTLNNIHLKVIKLMMKEQSFNIYVNEMYE